MELIAILFFLGVYLLISIVVVKAAMAWAKCNQGRPWLWGGVAGLLMYSLVFWDWIPTIVAYKYYCGTQAGFTVFKTPEQWLVEHSSLSKIDIKSLGKGSMLSTFPYQPMLSFPQKKVLMLNKYMYIGHEDDYFIINLLPIHRDINFIADINTDERLAQLVTFYTSYRDRDSWKAMKYWMHYSNCGYSNDTDEVERISGYLSYINNIIELGGKND